MQATTTRAQVEESDALIGELEASIVRYKSEYAALISEAQQIKTDMCRVEAKVTRSRALLASLEHEQHRWASESTSFTDQMGTVVGDVLLGAACIAYCGFFDQSSRGRLGGAWRMHLAKAGLECREELSIIEYLSTADQRAEWQAETLPSDDLCAENAVMLTRFNRYPLVIDPSGQAVQFLLNHYKDRKIVKTSFLDESFRKTLESALRFGTPLLVRTFNVARFHGVCIHPSPFPGNPGPGC